MTHSQTDGSGSLARTPAKRRYENLNELHFMDRAEFLQMAPAVVRLEISRLTRLVALLDPGSEVHTAAVAARFRLGAFLEEIARAASSAGAVPSADSLEAAIVSLGVSESAADPDTRETLMYVADRLGYIATHVGRLR